MRMLLLLLLLPAAVSARPQTMTVNDGSGPGWGAAVAQTVQEFNAIMPPGGPRLVYARQEPGACLGGKRAIAVCGVSSLPGNVPPESQAYSTGRFVYLLDATAHEPPAVVANTVCHEFMHALTGIPDNEDSRSDSCVWGRLTSPGPFDVAQLAARYPRKKR